jgi:hypothetical protein
LRAASAQATPTLAMIDQEPHCVKWTDLAMPAPIQGWSRLEPGVIQARYRWQAANSPLRQTAAWCE